MHRHSVLNEEIKMNKIKTTLILALLVLMESGFAQKEMKYIDHALNQYLECISVRNMDSLMNTIHQKFRLYKVTGDSIQTINRDQLVSSIHKNNNYQRFGYVTSLNFENNIATAKFHLYNSDLNRNTTGYILLLKSNNVWKIVSEIIDMSDENELSIVTRKNELLDIQNTLYKYLNSTSKNDINSIEYAYWDKKKLYSIEDGRIRLITKEVFLSDGFDQGFNEGIGEIVSIEFDKNIAITKLKKKLKNGISIEYMLLLKMNKKWKLIDLSSIAKASNINYY